MTFEFFEIKPLERRTDNIGQVFREVLTILEHVLINFGFERGESAYHPNSFGSMYANFTHKKNNEKIIRFVWDGKESTFEIAICQSNNIKPYPEWKELFVFRYNQFESTVTLDDLKQNMISEVEKIDTNFINQ